MEFVNKGNKPRKVRTGSKTPYIWKTLYTNDSVELPEIIGFKKGLKITTGKTQNKIVNTKQFDSKGFINGLMKIKGIGIKTAKDIQKVYSTKEMLLEALKQGKKLPFRDDIETKLRAKYYGKRV